MVGSYSKIHRVKDKYWHTFKDFCYKKTITEMEKSLVKDSLFFFYRDGENDSMSMCWWKLSGRK